MLFCAPVWNRGRQKQRHLSVTFRQDRSAGSKGFAGKSPHIYAECCGCMLSCSYCYQKDRLWLSDCFAVVRNRYGGALNFDIIHLITWLFDILRSDDYIRGYLRKCNWIYILPIFQGVNAADIWSESNYAYPGRSCGCMRVDEFETKHRNNEPQEVSRSHSTKKKLGKGWTIISLK